MHGPRRRYTNIIIETTGVVSFTSPVNLFSITEEIKKKKEEKKQRVDVRDIFKVKFIFSNRPFAVKNVKRTFLYGTGVFSNKQPNRIRFQITIRAVTLIMNVFFFISLCLVGGE